MESPLRVGPTRGVILDDKTCPGKVSSNSGTCTRCDPELLEACVGAGVVPTPIPEEVVPPKALLLPLLLPVAPPKLNPLPPIDAGAGVVDDDDESENPVPEADAGVGPPVDVDRPAAGVPPKPPPLPAGAGVLLLLVLLLFPN